MSNQNICNICGANYEYINGRWKCPACGAYKAEELSNEEVTLLYNAAQKLRLADFDEAERLYTDIIEKYTRNHSGYWGRLLSKYGIKYEEDFDGRKIPTCYATSIESVISDKDYLKAIQYADVDTKEYYQKQAEYIERVRKEWVEKASKEEPYDIFICYKDSDLANDIDRTHDSIEAQDLYIHLTAQGYRVFYSRESLRDKVGEKYEPYIFNALSTAKVMLVYGTSAEYITSTWLKNEWTRYEKRISLGEKLSNSLLVICDGFSPTELPKALASMQCFDAKRKTFYTDLDRCVKQIMSSSPIEVNYNSKEVSKTQSPLHEHRYKTSIVKSTCIAKGYTVHKCNCGYEYKDTYTPLVDHEYKVTKREEATCASDGSETRICDVCGEKQVTVLPRLPHQFSRWAVQERASCTKSGKSQRKCLVCGEIETKELPATGHEFGIWGDNSNNPTLSYCRKCGVSKSNKAYSNSTDIGNATSSWSDNIFSYEPESTEKSSTKAWGMFILCLFFGFTGIHKFIEKKTGYGFLYLFTAGLFYYGWIKDCINYYKIAKDNSDITRENSVTETISFLEIINNLFKHCKSFYTNETTRLQKLKHFTGIVFVWSMIIGISFSNTNVLSTVAAILAALSVIFGIVVSIASWNESRKYKRENGIPLDNRYVRNGVRITANTFFVFSLVGIFDALSPTSSDRITSLIMGIMFGVWFAILMLQSYCPKRYNKIQFTTKSQPVHRGVLAIIGTILTFVLIITLGVVGSSVNQQTKYDTLLSHVDAGDNEAAYILSQELSGYEDVDTIAAELYPLILKEAEELYLTGNASEAASLLERCGITENYDAYSCVANGEYKKSKLENIVIPNGTTHIAEDAFKFYHELKSVTIPNTVVSIGDNAFNTCDELTSITIPNSVTSIGDWAFANCRKLTEITISDNVTNIGSYAFYDCNSLKSLTISASVSGIGTEAFFNCKNLATINYCGTESQWVEITKGTSWDKYSPGWFMDYEQISYTLIFNYKDN